MVIAVELIVVVCHPYKILVVVYLLWLLIYDHDTNNEYILNKYNIHENIRGNLVIEYFRSAFLRIFFLVSASKYSHYKLYGHCHVSTAYLQ